jgi:hypothetical protein
VWKLSLGGRRQPSDYVEVTEITERLMLDAAGINDKVLEVSTPRGNLPIYPHSNVSLIGCFSGSASCPDDWNLIGLPRRTPLPVSGELCRTETVSNSEHNISMLKYVLRPDVLFVRCVTSFIQSQHLLSAL